MNKKLYDLMDWAEIETIVYSEHDHPEQVLGAHKVSGGILVQVFMPNVTSIFVKSFEDGKLYRMSEADEAGFFSVLVPGKKIFPYVVIAKFSDGKEKTFYDPYLYAGAYTEKMFQDFSDGKDYEVYRYLGAHQTEVSGIGKEACFVKKNGKNTGKEKISGTFFAVWAPNALRVSVVGDFNGWDGSIHPMIRMGETGVFALFLPEVKEGALYKFEIKCHAAKPFLKCDPYGVRTELRPEDANIVTELSDHIFHDAAWMEKRKKFDVNRDPMSVYELDLGTWMKKESGETPYTYKELAPKVAEYVEKMGYTHIELLPLMEYPADESAGYQVTGYYAVTARYGTPEEFMYFVDYMHGKNIGVIFDWVPAYFSAAESGLCRFDGTYLYERTDSGKNMLSFQYGVPQVSNFLIANAMFWKEVYHIDGLRVSGVAPMLYLDFGRSAGEWIPNEYGTNGNYAAIAFLRELSKVFHQKKDGAVLIAEESTAWPMVTGDTEKGLGFDLKWNMGWLYDFLSYMRIDSYFRKGSHDKLLMSMVYAYSEKFLLPFSHDAVEVGKGSLLMKMPGEMDQKYANVRAAIGFMMAHPGKKLLFMGQDFAQTGEWAYDRPVAWDELKESPHQKMNLYVKAWNEFYKKHPALYREDYLEQGFEWISTLDADHSIIIFMRKSEEDKEKLLVILNFTPVVYENFKVGVSYEGSYKEIFNSDKKEFGGMGITNGRKLVSKPMPWYGKENSITVNVPPLGISVFECTEGR